MSVTAYIKLKNGRGKMPKNYSYPQTRRFLDQAAKKLKVQPPTKFEYDDPQYFIQTVGSEHVKPQMIKRWKKQKEWHAASAGLKTFTALLKHLRLSDQNAVPAGIDRHGLLYDLEAFRIILAEAAKRKDSFRIEALL